MEPRLLVGLGIVLTTPWWRRTLTSLLAETWRASTPLPAEPPSPGGPQLRPQRAPGFPGAPRSRPRRARWEGGFGRRGL